MKRSLLAILLVTVTATSAFSATTANLVLKGVIPVNLSVEVSPTSLATTLPLDQAQNDQKVASLSYTSNSVTGFKLLARSAKGGKLVNTGSNNHFVNYQLKQGGNNISLNTSDTQFLSEQNSLGTFSKDITITYSQPQNLAAGEYTDTVTFTIQAN